jgi:hypothetical protein
MSLVTALLPSLVKMYTERVKTKSSAVAVAPLAAAVAVMSEATPLDPTSWQGLAVQVLMGLYGLYMLQKKETK